MGVYNKTLRWCEPYGGWDFSSNDTGLCNRILHWEIAYEINKKNNFSYKIILEKLHWPELDLIWLPDTACEISYEHFFGLRFDRDYQKLHFITVFDTQKNEVRKCSELDHHKVKNMFINDDFTLDDDHIYSNFGFSHLKNMYGRDIDYRPLSFIRLRHQFIEDFLRTNTKDVIGIHLRRDEGVKYIDENLEGMDKELITKYKKRNKGLHHVSNRDLNFVKNDVYFNLIDKILEINPHQKFFISSDLPKEYIEPFIEKYGNLILHRADFESTIADYLTNAGVRVVDLRQYNTFENVIDLFALSFCKMLIRADNSTWSEFAQHYRNQTTFSINDDIKFILDDVKNPAWGQPGDYHFNGYNYYYKKLQKTATR